MNHWFKSAGLVPKSISWGIIFCFLTNTLAYGNSLPLATPQIVPLPFSIQIPSEYGAIEEERAYSSQPLLIHIQDAHANPMGERNIARIITHLVQTRGIKTIFVEGAAENPEAKYLKFIQDEKLNQKLIDRLVDLGEVTGAELALIDPKIKQQIKLIGIEETETYRKDFDLFRDVMNNQEKSEQFLLDARKALDQKASRVLSKDLLTLFRTFLDLDEKNTRWLAFISDIYRMSRKVLGRDLCDAKEQIEFPNLVRLYRLKEEEGKINLEQVKKEVEREPRLREFLDKTLEINPRFFLEQINHDGKPQGFDFAHYPQFVRYARNRIFQYELESSALFEELNHLTEMLFSKLTNREEEKQIVQEGKEFKLMRDLLLLKLTRKEYGELKEVPSIASGAMDFYKKAIDREKVFEKKIAAYLKESKEHQAIVITGGFHTEGLKLFFQDQKISHTIIRPKIDGNALDIYTKSMMLGEGRSIEHSEIPKALMAQSLPAQAASLGKEAFEARHELVAREIQNVTGASLGIAKPYRDGFDQKILKQFMESEFFDYVRGEKSLFGKPNFLQKIDPVCFGDEFKKLLDEAKALNIRTQALSREADSDAKTQLSKELDKDTEKIQKRFNEFLTPQGLYLNFELAKDKTRLYLQYFLFRIDEIHAYAAINDDEKITDATELFATTRISFHSFLDNAAGFYTSRDETSHALRDQIIRSVRQSIVPDLVKGLSDGSEDAVIYRRTADEMDLSVEDIALLQKFSPLDPTLKDHTSGRFAGYTQERLARELAGNPDWDLFIHGDMFEIPLITDPKLWPAFKDFLVEFGGMPPVEQYESRKLDETFLKYLALIKRIADRVQKTILLHEFRHSLDPNAQLTRVQQETSAYLAQTAWTETPFASLVSIGDINLAREPGETYYETGKIVFIQMVEEMFKAYPDFNFSQPIDALIQKLKEDRQFFEDSVEQMLIWFGTLSREDIQRFARNIWERQFGRPLGNYAEVAVQKSNRIEQHVKDFKNSGEEVVVKLNRLIAAYRETGSVDEKLLSEIPLREHLSLDRAQSMSSFREQSGKKNHDSWKLIVNVPWFDYHWFFGVTQRKYTKAIAGQALHSTSTESSRQSFLIGDSSWNSGDNRPPQKYQAGVVIPVTQFIKKGYRYPAQGYLPERNELFLSLLSGSNLNQIKNRKDLMRAIQSGKYVNKGIHGVSQETGSPLVIENEHAFLVAHAAFAQDLRQEMIRTMLEETKGDVRAEEIQGKLGRIFFHSAPSLQTALDWLLETEMGNHVLKEQFGFDPASISIDDLLNNFDDQDNFQGWPDRQDESAGASLGAKNGKKRERGFQKGSWVGGRFQLGDPLDKGGFGMLFTAKEFTPDQTKFVRNVVLKFASGDRRDSKGILKQEFDLLESFGKHPNIVRGYEYVKDDSNGFIVMEHIEGDTLAQKLEDGEISSVSEALTALVPVAGALVHVHESGNVHLDVKPSNVMIDDEGNSKLIDFGIASRVKESGRIQISLDTLTTAHQGGGTLQFMAPELYRKENPSLAMDVFAFGVMLYQVVTGGFPFEEKPGKSLEQVILEDEPERPSDVAQRNGKEPVSEELEKLILSLLEKDPQRRPQSMNEVKQRLEQIRESAPKVKTEPITETDQASEIKEEEAQSEIDEVLNEGWLEPKLRWFAGLHEDWTLLTSLLSFIGWEILINSTQYSLPTLWKTAAADPSFKLVSLSILAAAGLNAVIPLIISFVMGGIHDSVRKFAGDVLRKIDNEREKVLQQREEDRRRKEEERTEAERQKKEAKRAAFLTNEEREKENRQKIRSQMWANLERAEALLSGAVHSSSSYIRAAGNVEEALRLANELPDGTLDTRDERKLEDLYVEVFKRRNQRDESDRIPAFYSDRLQKKKEAPEEDRLRWLASRVKFKQEFSYLQELVQFILDHKINEKGYPKELDGLVAQALLSGSKNIRERAITFQDVTDSSYSLNSFQSHTALALTAMNLALDTETFRVNQEQARRERLTVAILQLENPDLFIGSNLERVIQEDLDYLFNAPGISKPDSKLHYYRGRFHALKAAPDFQQADDDFKLALEFPDWQLKEFKIRYAQAEAAYAKARKMTPEESGRDDLIQEAEEKYKQAFELYSKEHPNEKNLRERFNIAKNRVMVGKTDEAMAGFIAIGRDSYSYYTANLVLIDHMVHEPEPVRELAALAYGTAVRNGTIEVGRVMNDLISRVKSNEEPIRKSTELALGVIGTPAISPLIQLIEDEKNSRESRLAAQGALGRMGKEAIWPLIQRLQVNGHSGQDHEMLALADAIVRSDSETGVDTAVIPIFEKVVEKEWQKVGKINAAILALNWIARASKPQSDRRKTTMSIIEKALGNESVDINVRGEAFNALLELKDFQETTTIQWLIEFSVSSNEIAKRAQNKVRELIQKYFELPIDENGAIVKDIYYTIKKIKDAQTVFASEYERLKPQYTVTEIPAVATEAAKIPTVEAELKPSPLSVEKTGEQPLVVSNPIPLKSSQEVSAQIVPVKKEKKKRIKKETPPTANRRPKIEDALKEDKIVQPERRRELEGEGASLGRENEKKSEGRSLGDVIDTGKVTENIFDSQAWKQWPIELRQLIVLPQAEASVDPKYRMQQVMNYLLTRGVSISDVMWNPVTVVVTQEFLEKTAENGEPLIDSLSQGDGVLVVMEDGRAHLSKEFLREKFPELFDLARKRKIHFDGVKANNLDRALQQKMMGFALMNKGGEQSLVLSNSAFANIAFDEPTLKLKPEDRKLVFTLLKNFARMSQTEREHAYRAMGFEAEGKLWVVGQSLGQILEKLEQDMTQGRLTSVAA